MKQWLRNFILLVLMLCSAMGAWGLKPRDKMAALNKNIRLENVIPKSFGEWTLDNGALISVINPQQAELLDVLYSQTLSRSYVNSSGQGIMLSIAYGETQAGDMELHRPEVCYVAQGFSLETSGTSLMKSVDRDSPIRLQRLLAHQSTRNEPITYWMRVGDDIVKSGTSQQLSRVRHGIKGWIPDGILVRVSSLSDEPDKAYRLQELFIEELLVAVDPVTRRFMVGPVSPMSVGIRQ